jgi:predicted nucleic-acid-binding Zn-ribbon protein
MPKKKDAMSVDFPAQAPKTDAETRRCPKCSGEMVRGEFSSVANFGVTKEPHFVATYGWMQVKYDRATPIDCYMCLKCGFIEFYGRSPLAVLDPMKRQEFIKQQFPELKKKLEKEESKRKEKETMETLPDSDEHTGI